MSGIPIQSAKFKKDFMVFSAFLLFFLIVGGELFLAVWLPWHLKLDRVWADHIARQELTDHFDRLRTLTRRAEGKLSKPASAESGLILRSLDSNAAFLHQYGRKLSPEQCRMFGDVLLKLHTQYAFLSDESSYSSPVKLDETRFLQTLRGVRDSAAGKSAPAGQGR